MLVYQRVISKFQLLRLLGPSDAPHRKNLRAEVGHSALDFLESLVFSLERCRWNTENSTGLQTQNWVRKAITGYNHLQRQKPMGFRSNSSFKSVHWFKPNGALDDFGMEKHVFVWTQGTPKFDDIYIECKKYKNNVSIASQIYHIYIYIYIYICNVCMYVM